MIRRRQLLAGIRYLIRPMLPFSRIRLLGLNPDLCYHLKDSTQSFYGDELMHAGLSTSDSMCGDSWDGNQAATSTPDFSSCRQNNVPPGGSMNIGRPIEIRANTISAWRLIAQTGRQVIQTYLPVLFYIFLSLYKLIVASDIFAVFQADQPLVSATTNKV